MYNVAVIGCGIIGLTSGIAIQEKFKDLVKVHIFTENVSPYTTGDVSAGLWTPYLLKNTPMESIKKWSKVTLEYCLDLWKAGYADEAGICILPITTVSNDDATEKIEWLPLTLGYQVLSKEDINKLNRDQNKTYKSGVTYVAVTSEVSKLMLFLQKQFLNNGGSISLKKIENFEQLSSYDIIINCSGLYSKILLNDDYLTPTRGQVVRVKAPWVFDTFLENNTYIIVNAECIILGGTAQKGCNNLQVDQKDTEKILTSCYNVIPSLKNSPIVKESVGLRPSRDEVRVEFELMKIKSKTIKVIHNYGHGGSGVTIFRGCALEVCAIVETVLGIQSSKL